MNMIASCLYSTGLLFHADFVLRPSHYEKYSEDGKKKRAFFFYEFEVNYKCSAKVSWANQHMKVAWSSLNGLKLVK